LVSPADLDALEERIRHINAVAKIHRTRNSDIPLDRVLDVGGFNLNRATELDPQFLQPEYPFEWAGAYPLPAGTHDLVIGHDDDDHDHHHDHDHDHGDEHHHHHHGNPDELDVVIMPIASVAKRDEPAASHPATAAAIESAALLFSEWENRVKDGDTVVPGRTL